LHSIFLEVAIWIFTIVSLLYFLLNKNSINQIKSLLVVLLSIAILFVSAKQYQALIVFLFVNLLALFLITLFHLSFDGFKEKVKFYRGMRLESLISVVICLGLLGLCLLLSERFPEDYNIDVSTLSLKFELIEIAPIFLLSIMGMGLVVKHGSK
jgi:NADH:ubiquinone oxidoreductase subunit 6 (subunit J)